MLNIQIFEFMKMILENIGLMLEIALSLIAIVDYLRKTLKSD